MRWGHIEIAGQIELHCAVKYAAHAHHITIDLGSPDPFKHLVYGVGVGEGVVSRLPVRVLIGVAEARHPKGRRVSERAPEVGRSCAGADRRLQRVNYPDRIVTEQLVGKRRMIGPPGCVPAGAEQVRQLADCFIAYGNKINRLAPSGRLVGATGRNHLTDDGRKQGGRMLPANQVKALECLVDEIERVSGVGERPLGLGC
jgi:hypothetical protein